MKTAIKVIDRAACRILHSVAEEAIKKAIAEQFEGVTVVTSPSGFDPSSFAFKVEIATQNEDGTANSRDASAFRTHAVQFGLSPADFGKPFTYGGEAYRIVGCRPKSYRFPICGERVRDGSSFKFPADVVRAALTVLTTAR